MIDKDWNAVFEFNGQHIAAKVCAICLAPKIRLIAHPARSFSPDMPQETPRLNILLRDVQAICEMKRGRKAALARFLGVRPSQISEWLTSQRFRPSAEYALGIAEWLREQQCPGS